MGDEREAGSITLVETSPTPRVVAKINIPAPSVVEGVAAIWTDMNNDGSREIIVTQSNAKEGARIVIYDEAGNRLAQGQAIGRGFRWRHQIAAAGFGPAGNTELIDVLTPHIGGTVELYGWEEDSLVVRAALPGYASHVIGSRNLDMAAAADFDGDGRVELLVPAQSLRRLRRLAAIRRLDDDAAEVWSLPLDGMMVTNLAVTRAPNRGLAVAAGRADGLLRIWQP
ncbi:MAG: hypothetical protein GXP42_02185 [Chloroflexi bacterium]|nr:hypothetical protein [Chloroflexota bacterium]